MALRRLGLLRIPEEAAPPAELARAVALYAALRQAEDCALAGVHRLRRDPGLLDAHRRMLPPGRRPQLDPIDVTQVVELAKLAEARTLDQALAALTMPEQAAVLAHAGGLARLMALRGKSQTNPADARDGGRSAREPSVSAQFVTESPLVLTMAARCACTDGRACRPRGARRRGCGQTRHDHPIGPSATDPKTA